MDVIKENTKIIRRLDKVEHRLNTVENKLDKVIEQGQITNEHVIDIQDNMTRQIYEINNLSKQMKRNVLGQKYLLYIGSLMLFAFLLYLVSRV